MSVKFSPDGFLDVATEPSDLPAQSDGKNEISGAMRRCTNLHLDKAGMASTRNGSQTLAGPVDETDASLLIEQYGTRYLFSADQIFQDETSIASGLTEAPWSGIKYNAYNSVIENIFCLNGYDRKRIVDDQLYEWGLNTPTIAPEIYAGYGTGLTGDYNVVYTYVRKEGDAVVSESNPSEPATEAVTLSNGSLRIIIPGPEDTQATHIRLYRTDAAGAVYYFDQEYPLPPSNDYAYAFDWEMQDEYIAGDGFKFTLSESSTGGSAITSTQEISDIYGQWSVVSGKKVTLGVTTLPVNLPTDPTASLPYVYVRIPAGRTGVVKYKKFVGSWDLSTATYFKWWIYNKTNTSKNVTLYMGESAYTEQTSGEFAIPKGWTQKSWDISGITETERDRITEFGFSHKNTSASARFFYFGPLTYDSFVGTYECTYPWEPASSASYDYSNSFYQWTDVVIDTTTDDLELGTEVSRDHDRPPLGTMIFGPSLDGICFIIKDNRLYYSPAKQPEYWPSLYYLEASPRQYPLKSGCLFDGQIYVATVNEIYLVTGSGHLSWSPPYPMSAICGTVSQNCFLGVKGFGVFHLGYDGLYLLAGGKDESVTHTRFKPIFEGSQIGSIPGLEKANISNCWLLAWKNKLYFGYPQTGSTYPDNFIVTDFSSGKSVHYYYGVQFPRATIDHENDRIIAVDSSGYIWQLENPERNDDNGEAIAWQIETKEYSDQLRKYFPRQARYDVNLGNGATANGYILLNGSPVQTHALTVSRKTKKRLIAGCTGDRIAMRITGAGPVDIYAVEVE